LAAITTVNAASAYQRRSKFLSIPSQLANSAGTTSDIRRNIST
jgi:hypothetical protein